MHIALLVEKQVKEIFARSAACQAELVEAVVANEEIFGAQNFYLLQFNKDIQYKSATPMKMIKE